jgi:ferrous iron transport protein A
MPVPLSELKPGEVGEVARIEAGDGVLAAKLREVGFSEGDEIELITLGPFGGQPLAVRLNRTLVALRRAEADAIEVERRFELSHG